LKDERLSRRDRFASRGEVFVGREARCFFNDPSNPHPYGRAYPDKGRIAETVSKHFRNCSGGL